MALEKLKDKLHIRRKSQSEASGDYNTSEGAGAVEGRESVDSELAAMTPAEREAYLGEYDDAERTDEPKKGSLIDKLIARGNKKTEDQIAQEKKDRETTRVAGKDPVIR